MKRLPNTFIAFLLLTLTSVLAAGAAQPEIVTKSQRGSFPIVDDKGVAAAFYVDAADAEVVRTAADAVASDIELITGIRPEVTADIAGRRYPVIAGTLGSSALIDDMARRGKIDTAGVAGRWEAYGLAVVDSPVKGVKKALVAYGSTPRGTAYALFELSRLMGVSPYVWWADVKPEPRKALFATRGSLKVGEPSVKFRGIFINDEDWGLTPWAAKNIDSKYNNIGPNTYARVMELLLRLRANVLWPAMHLCSEAFWANKDNLPVAHKYDIALGSSHCEQMLRDNEWEWRRYEDGTGTYENWNFVTNTDRIKRYWEERVAESKGYSAMYTLGMRGVHDWGISGYPSTEDKVRGLTEIIAFQRSLIARHIGDPTKVPQIFIPYKEVLDAYNAGLQVPEDVTLTWVDDNHGYIRQLPTEAEQTRSGGHGVYYHLSYWGTPEDYLWICSTSPSLISYELVKGYENGIRDLWVINVGDIKPAEVELEFCMDLAWDVDSWQPSEAWKYSRHWAAKTFGDDVADDIADIKLRYYRLAAAAKPEHVFRVAFTESEIENRLHEYAVIAAKADSVRARIPARLRDAYFEMVEYPVKGAWYMNVKTLRARQGEAYAAQVRHAHECIDSITGIYNTGIADGKWNGMMDCRPRRQRQFDLPEIAAKPMAAGPAFSTVEAAAYTGSRGVFDEFEGLGTGRSSIAVWPMDYTEYDAASCRAAAPYVEYTVPVRKGDNRIEIRCVPTFPVHSGRDLRMAVAVDGGEPQLCSLKTVATQGKWHDTVLRGYNDATVSHTAAADGTVTLRAYLLDPGIALSEIRSIHDSAQF